MTYGADHGRPRSRDRPVYPVVDTRNVTWVTSGGPESSHYVRGGIGP
jgi:hypothetical protein